MSEISGMSQDTVAKSSSPYTTSNSGVTASNTVSYASPVTGSNVSSYSGKYSVRGIQTDSPVSYDYNYSIINYDQIQADGFVTQGYTLMGKYALVTGHAEDDKDYARMYIYDAETGQYLGKMRLQEKCHAGGITYDESTGALFVSGSGKGKDENGDKTQTNILVYNGDRITEMIENNSGSTFDIDLRENNSAYVDTLQIDGTTLGSTVYAKDGKLYTGQFVGNGKGQMYEISYGFNARRNTINNVETIKFADNAPRMIQGMCKTEYNGQEYFLFSQSYSSDLESSIIVYSLGDDGSLHYEGIRYFSQPGIEGIDIDENGIISSVYEFKGQNVGLVNVSSLIDNISTTRHSSTEKARTAKGEKYDKKQRFKAAMDVIKGS